MAIPERSVLLDDRLRRRILVLDGAMGTMIQGRGLTATDFGGSRYEGCNEQLNLTRPDVVADIHAGGAGAAAAAYAAALGDAEARARIATFLARGRAER